jgi:hypothetical protein
VAGLPLTLTKPLGLGVLNNRHKVTGEVFPEAVATMTALNRDASRAALGAGARCATDVTGFGLLGHLFKLCRTSGLDAQVDAAAVPYLDGVRGSLAAGYAPGGSRRNLDWVRPHLEASVDDELVLLADAQTSGGLLVAGELPGHPVVGRPVAPSRVGGGDHGSLNHARHRSLGRQPCATGQCSRRSRRSNSGIAIARTTAAPSATQARVSGRVPPRGPCCSACWKGESGR